MQQAKTTDVENIAERKMDGEMDRAGGGEREIGREGDDDKGRLGRGGEIGGCWLEGEREKGIEIDK